MKVMRSKLQLQPQQSLTLELLHQSSSISNTQSEAPSSSKSSLRMRCNEMFADSRQQLTAAVHELQKLQRFARFSATSADVAWAESGWKLICPCILSYKICIWLQR